MIFVMSAPFGEIQRNALTPASNQQVRGSSPRGIAILSFTYNSLNSSCGERTQRIVIPDSTRRVDQRVLLGSQNKTDLD
jgi:hypothetical protein